MLLSQTAGLSGDEGELGQAITTLARMAKVTKPKTVESEFNKLFTKEPEKADTSRVCFLPSVV